MNDVMTIVCEYVKGTALCAKGTIGYFIEQDAATGKIRILVFSRSQRWVQVDAEEEILTSFRLRNLPGTHPIQSKTVCKVRSSDAPKVQELLELAAKLQQARDAWLECT